MFGEVMTTIRRASCLILLRPDGAGQAPYEFFMVKRSKQLDFLGGFHVFPGGTVDPVDERVAISNIDENHDLASAAIRELFEEAGVRVDT